MKDEVNRGQLLRYHNNLLRCHKNLQRCHKDLLRCHNVFLWQLAGEKINSAAASSSNQSGRMNQTLIKCYCHYPTDVMFQHIPQFKINQIEFSNKTVILIAATCSLLVARLPVMDQRVVSSNLTDQWSSG